MRNHVLKCLGVLLVSSIALADDVLPPLWRGTNRTVTAEFDSWIHFGSGTVDPDSWSCNPPGDWTWGPHASVTGGPLLYDQALGRTQVVRLGSQNDRLTFELPNYDQNPLKEVWFQVTYNKLTGQSVPTVNVWASIGGLPLPGYNGDYVNTSLVGSTPPDSNGWVTEAYTFSITPNPDQEAFALNFNMYPAYIDQVVIDTRCVPEPGTLCLLAAGLIGCLRRRGR